MRAPGGLQISLNWREETFHLPPPYPPLPPPGVCVLGSLPEPEGGISWGWLILCPRQTKELQQGATARGSRRVNKHLEWRACFLQILEQIFFDAFKKQGCPSEMAGVRGVFFPWASQR